MKSKTLYDSFVNNAEINGVYSDRSFKSSTQRFYADLLTTSKQISEVMTNNQISLRFNPKLVYDDYVNNNCIDRNEEDKRTIDEFIYETYEKGLNEERKELFGVL